jgi:hypothetical protein
MDLQEGGEGPLMGDPCPEVGVVVAEPAEDIKDEDAILHGPAQVAEGICNGLHLPAELANGKVLLDEGAEARIKS